VNGEKAARGLAGLAVLAVAVVAGIVSFTHIEALALAHGYAPGTARLLPVSVDGLIVASSLALLTGGRAQGTGIARAGLVLGIVATLSANVAAGARFGPVGALVNAWPAVAFVVASEIFLGMLRAKDAGNVPATVTIRGPESARLTVAAVPGDVDDIVPGMAAAAVPVDDVPPTRARRAPVGKPKAPESVFARDVASGTVPSIRQIKTTMRVGTPRAQAIRDDLAAMLREAQSEAA
jgi:hypothetical protein